MREFETNIRDDHYLLSEISAAYESGEDVTKVWALPDLYRALDAETIRQAARTYLNLNNYVKVTLFPEKK